MGHVIFFFTSSKCWKFPSMLQIDEIEFYARRFSAGGCFGDIFLQWICWKTVFMELYSIDSEEKEMSSHFLLRFEKQLPFKERILNNESKVKNVQDIMYSVWVTRHFDHFSIIENFNNEPWFARRMYRSTF